MRFFYSWLDPLLLWFFSSVTSQPRRLYGPSWHGVARKNGMVWYGMGLAKQADELGLGSSTAAPIVNRLVVLLGSIHKKSGLDVWFGKRLPHWCTIGMLFLLVYLIPAICKPLADNSKHPRAPCLFPFCLLLCAHSLVLCFVFLYCSRSSRSRSFPVHIPPLYPQV